MSNQIREVKPERGGGERERERERKYPTFLHPFPQVALPTPGPELKLAKHAFLLPPSQP
jgi:hypothetical protein